MVRQDRGPVRKVDMKSKKTRRGLWLLAKRRCRSGNRRGRSGDRRGRGRGGRCRCTAAAVVVTRRRRANRIANPVTKVAVLVVAVAKARASTRSTCRTVAKGAPDVVVRLGTLGNNDARYQTCQQGH